MSNFDLVSFDIFDTLVGRALFSPFDVFDKVEEIFNKKNKKIISGFRRNRILAEEIAREEYRKKCDFQEITLDEIYSKIKEIYDISDDEKNNLMEIELFVENEILKLRNYGFSLYKEFEKKSIDIVLVSDMYLDERFLLKKLSSLGITSFVEIFLSSNYRKRKTEGDLFKVLVEKTKINPKNIIHIGDNPVGDKNIPSSLGINTKLLSRSNDLLSKHSGNWAKYAQTLKASRSFNESAVFGLIADRFFDDPSSLPLANTDFGGNPFNFGFAALGPLVLGFASYIFKECKKNGINKILFLSRDGKIFKNAFDLIDKNKVFKTEYFYFSRRAARVASIYSKADIFSIISQPIYSTTIAEYFEKKFGLSRDRLDVQFLYEKSCTNGLDHKIGAKFSKEILKEIVFHHESAILENSASERIAFKKAFYLQASVDENIALVDIGYAGTLQAAFEKILKFKTLGLYLATFNTAKLQNPQCLMNGYLCDYSHPNYGEMGIVTHRFLYENIICDAAPSFTNYLIDEKSDELIKCFEQSNDDEARTKFVHMAHAGAVVFVKDFLDRFGRISDFELSSEFAKRFLDIFIKNPHPVDAAMFAGMRFEDSMGPSVTRFIVPPEDLMKKKSDADIAIWKEGAKSAYFYFLHKNKKTKHAPVSVVQAGSTKIEAVDIKGINKSIASNGGWFINFEKYLFKIILKEKLYFKYLKDRELFFADSNKKYVSFYYKNFGRFI